ncbi:YcnI family copper-binding membrane protein [Gemmobacter serpentinus]|uniref:YcnI family copper-binding membrane protein n=1 Tax=Gemmobacter serpentinus TaxID=2652247 RepID=UPI00124D8C94|nr:DUF1775 domain-containing protein [Gemmobacter serpentinus]
MIRNTLISLAFAAIAAPAFAHVSLEQPEAKVGATYKAVLRVPHGCGDLATQTLRVQIPEGFFNVKPMPKAGWVLETVKGKYAKAYDKHGTEVTEGVQEIVWSGGDLPNEFYDEFTFRGSFAGDLPVGSTFYFPVVQECAGAQEAWIDTSGDENAELPAPGVVLIEGKAH